MKKPGFGVLLAASAVFTQAEEIDVPIFIDVGLGPAIVEFSDNILAEGQTATALKLEASGYVKSETLKANRDKLPDEIPDWLLDTSVNAAPWWIPKTLYITPGGNGLSSVYGARIAPDWGVGLSLGPISLSGAIGVDLTYLYFNSALTDRQHFLRPGVHVRYEAALEPLDYFEVSIGQDRQQYWPMSLGDERSLGRLTETYVRFNIRIPYTLQVNL